MKIILLSLLVSCSLFAQGFKSKAVIYLPGQNKNIDFERVWDYDSGTSQVFACFENFNNNKYSIYGKKIEPFDTTNILISSDSIPKHNPQISSGPNNTFRILWQEFRDGNWQLFTSFFTIDSLSPIIQLTHSDKDNITPQLNETMVVWISNQDLMHAEINDSLNNITKVDSGNCSMPNYRDFGIIYQKALDGNTSHLKMAHYSYYENEWKSEIIVENGIITNQKFAYDTEMFTYQQKDTVWRGYLSEFNIDTVYSYWISGNQNYNIENPFYFYYPTITLKSQNEIRDWFLVYESDSIDNNKEIILEFYPENDQDKINISDLPGDDINPKTIQINDSVAIFWEHIDGNNSYIYLAKEKFVPYTNTEEKKNINIVDFTLYQNYPNPFNPTTYIEYFLPYPTKVSLNIYDVLGRKIKTIFSKNLQIGKNKIVWDGTNNNGSPVGTGIYFYVLEYGVNNLSKKMVLIR